MEIGILTFHRAENFGAALQVYALQEFLKNLHHNVYVIDYRCPPIERNYQILNPSYIWHRRNIWKGCIVYLNRFKNLKERKDKKKSFHDFLASYINVKTCETISDCDIVIVGSDQVWNMAITQGYRPYYFLNFQHTKPVRKIAYAASSEPYSFFFFDANRNQISNDLLSFDAISVREQALKSYLGAFVKKEISLCVDPTFLLSSDEYKRLAIKPLEQNYVLVYHLYETKEGSSLAQKISEEKGFSVVEIHSGYGKFGDKNIHKQDVGPRELLGYILYANQVITTSFHGVALSIILEKNFLVINKGNIERIKNLLALSGLSDRLISQTYDYCCNDINYSLLGSGLKNLIKDSKKFLIDNTK